MFRYLSFADLYGDANRKIKYDGRGGETSEDGADDDQRSFLMSTASGIDGASLRYVARDNLKLKSRVTHYLEVRNNILLINV